MEHHRAAALVLLAMVAGSRGDADVRLAGSTSNDRGYVEVRYHGVWGTVCRDGWGFLDAFVVCRQLGFGWVSYRGWEDDYGTGAGPAWLSNVTCVGSERSLTGCPNDGWDQHDCSYTSSAAVSCGNIDGYSSADAYLGDGLPYDNTASEGNVYLKFLEDKYYALPDYNWDIENANVLCRQQSLLSLRSSVGALAATNSSYFGRHDDKLKPYSPSTPKTLKVTVLPIEFTCRGDEASLADCPAQALPDDIELAGHDAGVKCLIRKEPMDFKIRLVGGNSPLEGVVEVFHDNSWGSVQYRAGSVISDTNFADVVCRQLGQGYPTVVSNDGRFGQSSPNIKMKIVACSGAENSLAECGSQLEWTEDVGQGYNLSIVCSGPVEIGSIPARFYTKGLPSPSGQVQALGTLQVFHDGRFGTVCNDGWTYANSKVVCKQMGYGPPVDPLSLLSSSVGGPMYLNDVSCKGDETSLEQCSFGDWLPTTCNHSQNAIITCSFQPNEHAAFWDQTTQSVRVFFQDTWGAICADDDWDFEDDAVVCRQVGYKFALTSDAIPNLTGVPVWLGKVQCAGDEGSLQDCSNDGWKTHSCDSIVGMLGCKNEDGYIGAKAYIADGLGDHAVASEGTAFLRLTTGKVLRLCDQQWDLNDAKAFCRQIGKYSAETAITSSYFGYDRDLDTLKEFFYCTGRESSMEECPAGSIDGHFCYSVSNAGVRCLEREEPEGFKIRLTGGSTDNQGRVEVFYDGSWGTVGNDVNLTYALRYGDVVCRQLDLGYAVEILKNGDFGNSALPVKMTGVWCAGSESSLAQCGPNVKWVDTPGGSLVGDNTGIKCSGKIPEETYPLRLGPESSSELKGYLELFQDGRFGTICNITSFSWTTDVACRQLGFIGAADSSQTARASPHGGPIYSLTKFKCMGDEKSLSECPQSHLPPSLYQDCTHSSDLYIKCKNKGCSDEHLCLHGGFCDSDNKCHCYSGYHGEMCENAGVKMHTTLFVSLVGAVIGMLSTVVIS